MRDASDQPGHGPDGRDRSVPPVDRPGTRRPPTGVRLAGFVLTSQAERDTDRISVAGRLAGGTALLLEVETIEVCRVRSRTTIDLVLDLTEVTVLDGSGVATLRRVHDRALLQGGLRLGLPVAPGPSRLLALAVAAGMLPPVFGADTPIF